MPTKRILIVEDDAALAETLARAFTRRGYETTLCHNGQEALVHCQDHTPHYAVVDLRMPGMSGLECVDGLHRLNPDLRIVVLTGYASITTAVEAIKLGACHYLAKPANVDDILAAFDKTEGNPKQSVSQQAQQTTSIKHLEWERIHEMLVETNFNISETARRLGMHRRTLARKLEKRRIK